MSSCGTAFLIAIIVSIVITPAVIKLAAATGAMDKPDARKVHKKPIPRIGGVGIYFACIVSVIAMAVLKFLSAWLTIIKICRRKLNCWDRFSRR